MKYERSFHFQVTYTCILPEGLKVIAVVSCCFSEVYRKMVIGFRERWRWMMTVISRPRVLHKSMEWLIFLKVACTVFYNVVLCGFCPPYIDIFDVEDGSELEV